MAAFRVFGKWMEDLKTAITGSKDKDPSPNLELIEARVKLGFNTRLGSGDTSLSKDVRDNGPLTVIGPISLAARSVRGPGPIRCAINIYIQKDKKDDWDGIDIADLLDNVITKLLTESSYTNSGLLPGHVALTGIDYEAVAHPGTLVLRLEVESIPEI